MTSNDTFIPGLELARLLHAALLPRLRDVFPQTPLALGLFGPGSDVVGFDTARSMDHDWGPRLIVVVPEDQRETTQARLESELDVLLPTSIAGFSTRFGLHPDGTAKLDVAGSGHRIRITSVEALLRESLLIDSQHDLTDAVWLSTPMQVLIELTEGAVWIDDTGELTGLRDRLAFYPDHIWRYQLAGLWMRVSQLQPFIGRTAEVGDHAGSRILAATIARDLMRIALLQSRRYAPYPKWLGTAFARTDLGQELSPQLERALITAPDWEVSSALINRAGEALVRQLNGLNLIDPIDPAAVQFWDRPFMVLPAEQIALDLQKTLAHWPHPAAGRVLGGVDCISDSTDALCSAPFRLAVRSMFTKTSEMARP